MELGSRGGWNGSGELVAVSMLPALRPAAREQVVKRPQSPPSTATHSGKFEMQWWVANMFRGIEYFPEG